MAKATIDLTGLETVLKETDPNIGVGPRGLRPNFLHVLYNGNFTHPEAKNARDNLELIGTKYLTGGFSPWFRRILGGGLLTPLNKVSPDAGTTPDQRPVRSEDSDTSAYCRALAREMAGPVKDAVIPQQLGIQIPDGIGTLIHGLRMEVEGAIARQEPLVFVTLDIKNAHNDFPRDVAMRKAIAAAQSDPRLIPLAVAMSSTLMNNPVFMRSNSSTSGYDHICDSRKGSGQGNALTGQEYVITQNDSLKEIESEFSVIVKAIHDDITLYSAPPVMFGTADDGDGGLESLIGKLEKDCGLTINR